MSWQLIVDTKIGCYLKIPNIAIDSWLTNHKILQPIRADHCLAPKDQQPMTDHHFTCPRILQPITAKHFYLHQYKYLQNISKPCIQCLTTVVSRPCVSIRLETNL